MRKGMIQLWSDLEAVADGLGLALTVRKVRASGDGKGEFDASGLVDFHGNGPQVIRANSTYYKNARKIIMNVQADFTPAYKAGILAHEIGHHLSQVVYGNVRDRHSTASRHAEEVRASLHAYELLYSLTNGRVPLGCIDMLNISLASYVGKDEQL